MHGLMIDSARAMERPEYYLRLFRFMVERGADTVLWHFTDDQGCSLVFDALPEAASPHALTKMQMKALLAEARSLGLQVIPELETYGHTRYITNLPTYAHLREGNENFSGMCPVLPESRKIVSALITEVADLFDSPWIHVGMDEVAIGEHPATQEVLRHKTVSQLYAEHAHYVYDRVTSHGKRMMMWGDHIIKDATIAEDLPHDIAIAAWHYRPEVDPAIIHPHLERGFDVLLCGAVISYDQMLFPGEDFALPNLRCMSRIERMVHPGPGKIIGQISTVWTPTRYMHDALWIALDLAMAFLTEGPHVDAREKAEQFAREFYGITPSPQWLDAIDTLYALSPTFYPWIELLQGRTHEGRESAVSLADAPRWRRAHDALAGMLNQVHQNQQAYATFMLMVDVLASLHERAIDVSQGRMEKAIQTTQRLINEVKSVWDRERYGDDSRKNHADWARDRVNSLIEQLHVGMRHIQSMQML